MHIVTSLLISAVAFTSVIAVFGAPNNGTVVSKPAAPATMPTKLHNATNEDDCDIAPEPEPEAEPNSNKTGNRTGKELPLGDQPHAPSGTQNPQTIAKMTDKGNATLPSNNGKKGDQSGHDEMKAGNGSSGSSSPMASADTSPKNSVTVNCASVTLLVLTLLCSTTTTFL